MAEDHLRDTAAASEELLAELLRGGDLDDRIPTLARDAGAVRRIERLVREMPTSHRLICADARQASLVEPESVHLVVTSPPYWTLKRYPDHAGQLGSIADYDDFIGALGQVWLNCYRALVPGGRLVIDVGDVCLSRKRNNGRHTVVPLHATIQEQCRKLGFDNLATVFWNKISNARYEAAGAGGFLGKPYEPNAVIKNDVEFILMQRKPGGYRSPSRHARLLSLISAEDYQRWFRQVWTDVRGTSHPHHPAPYPVELAERLVRMFSFVGDTVLDPFMGTGTTNLACAQWGRNSVGIELDATFMKIAQSKLDDYKGRLFDSMEVTTRNGRNTRS